MAEYIDRVQAMNIIASGKNDNAYFGTTGKDWEVIDFLKTVPTADVVEREKIDKAIKEMVRYSASFKYANRHDIANAVDYCIGVIQRNI